MEKEQIFALKQELKRLDLEEWSTDLKLQTLIILELREIRKKLENMEVIK